MINKKLKLAIVLLLMMTIICNLFFLNGCDSKEKRYDVTLKIVRRVGTWAKGYIGPIVEEYLFTVDVEDMYVEWQYDGDEYTIRIDEYNFPDHPDFNQVWFPYSLFCNLHCDYSLVYVDDENTNTYGNIQEKGNYLLTVKINGSEDTLYKSRTVRLHISIV